MAVRASSQQGLDPGEIFPLLESMDIHVAQEIKSEVQDNLNSSARDPSFLHALVSYYMKTNSPSALDILAGVREPLDKTLLDKLNEYMQRSTAKLKSFTLLSHVVRRQPSWLHKIVGAPVFTTVLNCLKTDMEIPVIMCGLLVVTTLLPMIPSQLGPFLEDVFSIFARFTSWSVEKPGSIPEVYQLHLQVAVHALFHRLYGMYPWNFMEFLRSHYGNKLTEFNEAILPMLERVRVHPLLVVGSLRSETDKARWRKMEVHDVLTECARLALDATESSQEEISVCSFPMAKRKDHRRGSKARILLEQIGRTSSPIVSSTGGTPSGSETNTPHMKRRQTVPTKIDPVTGSLVASHDVAALSLWSPAIMCPLSTPPSSRPPSPSTSQLDVSLTSVPHHYPISQADTPFTTPRDSPYPSGTDSARLSGVYSDISTPCKFTQSGGSKSSLHRRGHPPPILSQAYGVHVLQMHSAPNTPGYTDTSQSGSCFRFQMSAEHKPVGDGQKKRPKSMGHTPTDFRGQKGQSEAEKNRQAGIGQEKHETSKQGTDAEGGERSMEDRTSSSVSLRDLPDVMKEFTEREEDVLNEEVLSLVGSPYPESSIDQLGSKDTLRGGTDLQLSHQHSWPGAISAPEQADGHGLTTTQPMSQSADRRRDGIYTYAPLSQVGVDDKNFLISSYDGQLANHIANESTESTSSGGSIEKTQTRERTTRTYTSKAHNVSSKLQSADTLSSENSQSFRPINDQSLNSLESSFTIVSTQSTTSDLSYSTSGQYDSALPMPYMHLYQCIMPGVQRLPPSSATDQTPSSVASLPSMSFTTPLSQPKRDSLPFHTPNDSRSSTPFYATLSPSEILDRHIELGTTVHSKELDRLPLASQDSVNWTHFGGEPPVDEINILKDQLVLLHNQLLYERHKREVHAERNRRLLGKTHKAKAYEESNHTMREQLDIQNKEMGQLMTTLKLLQQQNRQLQEDIAYKDQEQHSLWQKLHTENEHLKEANQELQKLLVDHKQQVDKAIKEVQNSEAELFTAKKELNNVQTEVAINRHLKDEIARLNRELLLMGEANEKYHEDVEKLRPTDCGTEKEDLILAATKKELTVCRENLKKKSILLEAAKCRITEIEGTLTQKDVAMNDQKRFLENVKTLSKGKLEAMESKYGSLTKAYQRLEAHILRLNKKLNEKNIRDHPKRHHPKSEDPNRTSTQKSTQSKMERHQRPSNNARRKSNSESASSSARLGAIQRSDMLTSSHEDSLTSRQPKERLGGEDTAKSTSKDEGSKSERSTPAGISLQEARLSQVSPTESQDSNLSSDWAHLSSEMISAGRSSVPDKTFPTTSSPDGLNVSSQHKHRGGSPVKFSEESLFKRVSKDETSPSPRSSPSRASPTRGSITNR